MEASAIGKLKEYSMMSFGCFLMAIGIYFFKIPNGFAAGRVTGIGTVLTQLTPVSAGAWMLNIALLLVGFLFLGSSAGVKTIYCSMLYSAMTYAFEAWIPLTEPLSNQTSLSCAMLLTSIGAALIFHQNASSGERILPH